MIFTSWACARVRGHTTLGVVYSRYAWLANFVFRQEPMIRLDFRRSLVIEPTHDGLLFSWNVNLVSYCSWFLTWRFCVTCEGLELLTNIRDLPLYCSWFWHASPPNAESCIENTRRYEICEEASWLSLSRFCFLQAFFLVQELSYLLTFVIRENEIFISVIRWSFIFSRSWTVPETLLYDTQRKRFPSNQASQRNKFSFSIEQAWWPIFLLHNFGVQIILF